MLTLDYQGIIIVLPSPEFRDTFSTNFRKIINKTRGNEIIISKKTGYDFLDSIKTYSYRFMFIEPILRYNLLNFLGSTTGQVITITDYDNTIYNGIIITPANDIIQSARNNNEISLEIEVIDPTLGDFIVTQGYLSPKIILQGFGL